MRKISEIIDNEQIWFVVDECFSSESKEFLGYISFFNTQEPKLILGESVKDENHKMLVFKSEEIALSAAKEYYLAKRS